MGISKTEINLRRLIAAAPQQQNQAKLIHYVATLRELLEQLTEETTQEGLPRVSKAKINDYSEKIESIASKLVPPEGTINSLLEEHLCSPDSSPLDPEFLHHPESLVVSPLGFFFANLGASLQGTSQNIIQIDGAWKKDTNRMGIGWYLQTYRDEPTVMGGCAFGVASSLLHAEEIFEETSTDASPPIVEEVKVASPPGLRKRPVPSSFVEDRSHDNVGADSSPLVKLDAAAHSHIEKHRKLQEDLTDEMVGMARQLKESSLLMSQSLQNSGKILDSTEKAIEHSLASTSHANVRAMNIFSRSSKTSCFTWLLMFFMLMVFMMVVFLIRIT